EKHFFALFSLRKFNFHAEICSWTERSEKKAYERSEFRVAFALAFAFSQIHEGINRKIAP
ncbi:hypothetical protein WAJ29_19550, partial [Acinetobacter baumannii]